jgi:hypothetical protein
MRPTPLALALALALPLSGACRAQAPASQRGSVAQVVDSTTITVEYYRPSARGRTIFGRLVPWGDTWTPGANWATTLDVDRDVRIEGHALASGRYTMWFIPRADSAWTVMLVRGARRFHLARPTAGEEQLRFDARAEPGPHVEMLTFTFPEVSRDAATLRFAWAETVVAMRIAVEPSHTGH